MGSAEELCVLAIVLAIVLASALASALAKLVEVRVVRGSRGGRWR